MRAFIVTLIITDDGQGDHKDIPTPNYLLNNDDQAKLYLKSLQLDKGIEMEIRVCEELLP